MPLAAPSLDERTLASQLARLLPDTRSADVEIRRAAFVALLELGWKVGERLASGMPALLDGLADPDERIGESAVHALSHCSLASLIPLINALARPEPHVRERAARALGVIGDKAKPAAATALRDRLADDAEPVRRRAAWALGLLHDTDPHTIDALAALVGTGTTSDRAAALHALGNIGRALPEPTRLREHGTAILAGLADPDADVRRGAKHAFEALGSPVEARVERYLAMLATETSPPLREVLRHDLAQLAAQADLRPHVPALVALLAAVEPDARDAVWAAKVLADMNPAPPEAAVTPALEGAMHVPRLRLAAGRALWRITGRVDAYLAALADGLATPGEDLCDLVTELGPLGAPLVPQLVAALADDSWADLQWAAAVALGAVASPKPEALRALVGALTHASPIVRQAASRALSRMTESVPQLVDILESADPAAPRAAAARALAQMGRAARPARPALKALRETPDPVLRDAVHAALKASTLLSR